MDAKNNNDNIAKAPTDREEWIAVRRSALYDYFNLPEKNKAEAEALFDKMRALTAECADQGEFETRLAQSPLNKEYTDLFTKKQPPRQDRRRHGRQERIVRRSGRQHGG